MNERQRAEALGIGLVALGLVVGLALLSAALAEPGAEARNWIGPAGAFLSLWLTRGFGLAAFLVILPAFAWATWCFRWIERDRAIRGAVLAAGTLVLLPAGVWIISSHFQLSIGARTGWLGVAVGELVAGAFGWVGGGLIVGALLLALCVLTLGWSPIVGVTGVARRTLRTVGALRPVLGKTASWFWRRLAGLRMGRRRVPHPSPWQQRGATDAAGDMVADGHASSPAEHETGIEADTAEEIALFDPGDLDQTALPPLDLLSLPERSGSGLDDDALRNLGDVLVQKLATFKVEGHIGGWTTGPVVTQFEVVPAAGVKVGQISALAGDLALALKAPSVRIVAPIPGKGAVGVEVPNPEPEIVHLRRILESPAYGRSRAGLPLALGRDLAGRPYTADLARMPHLLIAGATGSGKSVCINTIVTSLVYRYTPRELRLLMVDPKMVELIIYNDLPHLRHPVVIDNHEAAAILKWAVFEMGRRYALLSANSCRNLNEFNRRVKRGDGIALPPGWGGREYTEGELAYIVLVIDELADLMMTVQAEVETPLALLAQKARAVGMHLVVATQRPSVNVITGLIKANFSSRIAFRVSSKIDSRTILDQNGAESLLGNGDMLFLPPGESDPIRLQGAFLATSDTERLLGWYRARAAAKAEGEAAAAREGSSEPDLLEIVREIEAEESRAEISEGAFTERDALFCQAAEIVIANSSGSTSLLQRRLKIGYGRAARVIDQLHDAGILGPPDGSRPREVLVTLDQLEELLRGERETG